jgi:hypothetical protein
MTRYTVILADRDQKIIAKLTITASDGTDAHIRADRLAGQYRAATYQLIEKGGAR